MAIDHLHLELLASKIGKLLVDAGATEPRWQYNGDWIGDAAAKSRSQHDRLVVALTLCRAGLHYTKTGEGIGDGPRLFVSDGHGWWYTPDGLEL